MVGFQLDDLESLPWKKGWKSPTNIQNYLFKVIFYGFDPKVSHHENVQPFGEYVCNIFSNHRRFANLRNTVDGRNPAPPDMYEIL